MAFLYSDNENCIKLEGLFDELNQEFVNDATATVTIVDQQDNIIINNQAMLYQAGSDGDYVALIDDGVALPEVVKVNVVAEAPDGATFDASDDTVYVYERHLNGF